ncbi:MAG: M48 family metalloprotease [Bacteroidota bacterium]
MKLSFNLYPLFLTLLFFVVSSCSRNPVTGKKEFMLMSESQEINMGKSYDPQVTAMYGVYQDEKLQAFINKKGKEMAAISHRPHLPYEFKIVDSPVVNAFAVPGGFVYFTRGIMAHFNNEAEFAGVLGHEIGHITARHSARQYSNQMLGQALFVGGLIVSEDFRNFADVASQGMGLLFLKFGRDNETESDRLGVDYSTYIGYDAKEMADFFNTLKRMRDDSGQSIPTFLSTHPDPGDRYFRVREMATAKQKANPNQQYQVNRDSYLRMIDGIVYGEDPRQGFVENNIFYHPELKFQFPVPQGWGLNNLPVQVQMSSSDGKAMMTMDLATGTDLNAAANEVIQKNQLTVIDRSNVRVNGLNAIAMITEQRATTANDAQTPTLRILTYLIQYDGRIYKFHGLSAVADFNRYFSTFQRTMDNFKRLTDRNKLNKKPTVVIIKPARKTGTLQSILTDYRMPANLMNELSLLNGMNLTDQVKAGTLIKTLGEMRAGNN